MLFKTLYIQIFKMAAMLQQQYVVLETEPRDWAACGVAQYGMFYFCARHTLVSAFNCASCGELVHTGIGWGEGFEIIMLKNWQ